MSPTHIHPDYDRATDPEPLTWGSERKPVQPQPESQAQQAEVEQTE